MSYVHPCLGKNTYFPFEQWWKKPLWTFRVCNKNYPVSHGKFQDPVINPPGFSQFHVTFRPWVLITAHLRGGISLRSIPQLESLGTCGWIGCHKIWVVARWVFWEQVGWVVYLFLPWKWKMAGFLWKVTTTWRNPFLTSMIKGLGWWFQIFCIFTPILREDEPNLTCAYFSKGLVQPPTRGGCSDP